MNVGKVIPEERQLDAFGPNMREPELRRKHEIEGARIAGEILAEAGFAPDLIEEIQTIIDGHDSRKGLLSLSDMLVKDADKLWRFTPTGVTIDHRRFGIDLDEYLPWLGRQIDRWFFSVEAREMAQEVFAETRTVLKSAEEESLEVEEL